MDVLIFWVVLVVALVFTVLGCLRRPNLLMLPAGILFILLGALMLNPGIQYKSGEFKTFSYVCSAACSENRNMTSMNFTNTVFPSMENTQFTYSSFNYESFAGLGVSILFILFGVLLAIYGVFVGIEERQARNPPSEPMELEE